MVPGSASSLGTSSIAWWRCGSSFAPGRLDAGDERLHPLVFAQLLWDRGERAFEIVLHAQHLAGEGGRGILRGGDLLLLQPAAHVLGLGLRVERVLADLLKLLLKLAEPVDVQLAAVEVDFAFQLYLGFFLVHPINLVSAFAVKSTMGTTRA
jgi:hypothetical protein